MGLGSAATYSVTTSVTSGSSALVTSGAVYTKCANYYPLAGGTLKGHLIFNYGYGTRFLLSNGGYAQWSTPSGGAGLQLYYVAPNASNWAGYAVLLKPDSSGTDFTTIFVGTLSTSSDRRKKYDIASLDETKMLNFVTKLNPVSYKNINSADDKVCYGLIAQEVEEVLSSLDMEPESFDGLVKDENGDGDYTYGLKYQEFIAPLIKCIQALKHQIEEIKSN